MRAPILPVGALLLLRAPRLRLGREAGGCSAPVQWIPARPSPRHRPRPSKADTGRWSGLRHWQRAATLGPVKGGTPLPASCQITAMRLGGQTIAVPGGRAAGRRRRLKRRSVLTVHRRGRERRPGWVRRRRDGRMPAAARTPSGIISAQPRGSSRARSYAVAPTDSSDATTASIATPRPTTSVTRSFTPARGPLQVCLRSYVDATRAGRRGQGSQCLTRRATCAGGR